MAFMNNKWKNGGERDRWEKNEGTRVRWGFSGLKSPSKNSMHYKSVSKNLNSENPKAFTNSTYI